MIRIKRVYDRPAETDGCRVLVDRLWPRGMKRAALRLDTWLKEVAPSSELRRWFNHEPARWPEFQRRYRLELEAHPESWAPLLEQARRGTVTLLYSAHDAEHNNAVVLRDFLDSKLAKLFRRSRVKPRKETAAVPLRRPRSRRAP